MGMTIQASGIIPTLTLGQRLDVARKHGGYKPETLATQRRCSATTIRNYLSGRTRIDYAHAVMWSQLTGVDLDWLLRGTQPTDREPFPATFPVTPASNDARMAA